MRPKTRLREIRRARGLSQAQLAEFAGIRQPHIARAEKGVHTPSLATSQALAKGLNVRLATLLLTHCPQCGHGPLQYQGETLIHTYDPHDNLDLMFIATKQGTIIKSKDHQYEVKGIFTEVMGHYQMCFGSRPHGIGIYPSSADIALKEAIEKIIPEPQRQVLNQYSWHAFKCICSWTY